MTRAGALEADGARRISVLHHLVRALGNLPGRKHLVLVSGGLPSANRPGARPDLSPSIAALADVVAGTDVLLYTVHWVEPHPAWPSRDHRTLMGDRDVDGVGLEQLALQSNGAAFEVNSGAAADVVLDRILRETAAHYVLGVQLAPADRDGLPHSLQVRVNRRNAIVRSRTKVQLPLR